MRRATRGRDERGAVADLAPLSVCLDQCLVVCVYGAAVRLHHDPDDRVLAEDEPGLVLLLRDGVRVVLGREAAGDVGDQVLPEHPAGL